MTTIRRTRSGCGMTSAIRPPGAAAASACGQRIGIGRGLPPLSPRLLPSARAGSARPELDRECGRRESLVLAGTGFYRWLHDRYRRRRRHSRTGKK